MLVPAILYKNEIENKSKELCYSDQAFYYGDGLGQNKIYVEEEDQFGELFQYAILNSKKELIGYYFYFSKIIEKKRKLTKYDRDRHLSFKKTDIRKRIATSGKNMNKLHLTQRIDGPIFSEKPEIKRKKKKERKLRQIWAKSKIRRSRI